MEICLLGHKCAEGFISCPDCKYSTLDHQEMNYHIIKKHAQPSSKQSTACYSCEQELPNYYSLQQQRRKEHGTKQRKSSDTVADLNKIVEEVGEDGETLRDELSACQDFPVETEMENWRHKVNFQISKLDVHEKLEEVFNKLDSAAKINIALEYILPNIEAVKIGFNTHSKIILGSKILIYCVRSRI